MPKPSVLLMNRVVPPVIGASGRMMRDLALALQQSGWEVSLLSAAQDGQGSQLNAIPHYKVKPVKNHRSLWGYMTLWWRMKAALHKIPRHDVIISLSDPPLLGAMAAGWAQKHKAAHIHWCHDVYPDLLPKLGVRIPDFVMQRLMKKSRRMMNEASHIVVIGECMSKHLAQTGVGLTHMTMIPNWPDLDIVSPGPKAKQTYSTITDIPQAKKPEEMFRDSSPKFRVLYSGHIGRAHPMKAAIEAAELLAPYPEIEFVFVGADECHERLIKERGKRGLENIKFLPLQPIERYRSMLETGDLHLVTLRDGCSGHLVPCKFYSALSVGRPTVFVGPETSEVAQVLQRFQAGHTVSPHDSQGLANLIYGYRMDGEAWFRAQEGALQAAQAYHPNQSLEKWVDLAETVRLHKGGLKR